MVVIQRSPSGPLPIATAGMTSSVPPTAGTGGRPGRWARIPGGQPRRRTRCRPAHSPPRPRVPRRHARPATPMPSRTNRKPSPRAKPLRSTSRSSGRVTALIPIGSHPRGGDELRDAARQQPPLDGGEACGAEPLEHLDRRRQVRRRSWAGTGTAGSDSSPPMRAPPCRSTRCAPSGSRRSEGWRRRAGRCAHRAPTPRRARRRTLRARRGCAARSRTSRRRARRPGPGARGCRPGPAAPRLVSSIPNERSMDTGRPLSRQLAVAGPGEVGDQRPGRFNERTASRRQRTSSRNVIRRLTRS